MKITTPYPPSVNHMWVRNRNGSVRVSAAGKLFRDEVTMMRPGPGKLCLTGRLAVSVRLHAPDKRRRDLDNSMKALLDALAHALVYVDDSQIDRLVVERGPVDRKNPRAEVEVVEI